MAMTNFEWIAINNIRAGNAIRRSDFGNWMVKNHFGEDVDYWFVKWLDMEYKEPILDDVEKQYLSAVIKPFRDRVWYIMKSFSVDKASCYIFIRFNDGSSDMEFPVFRKSDMYEGMKICKAYTIEELGI